MALFSCPECSQQVSTNAAACPQCGNPVGPEAQSQTAVAPPSAPARAPASSSALQTPSPLARLWRWPFNLIFPAVALVAYVTLNGALTYWERHRLPPQFTHVTVTGTVAQLSGNYNYSNDFETDARKLHESLWVLATRRPSVTHLSLRVLFHGADEYGSAQTQDLGTLEIADVNEIRKYQSLQAFLDEDKFKVKVVNFLMLSRNSPYKRF